MLKNNHLSLPFSLNKNHLSSPFSPDKHHLNLPFLPDKHHLNLPFTPDKRYHFYQPKPSKLSIFTRQTPSPCRIPTRTIRYQRLWSSLHHQPRWYDQRTTKLSWCQRTEQSCSVATLACVRCLVAHMDCYCVVWLFCNSVQVS